MDKNLRGRVAFARFLVRDFQIPSSINSLEGELLVMFSRVAVRSPMGLHPYNAVVISRNRSPPGPALPTPQYGSCCNHSWVSTTLKIRGPQWTSDRNHPASESIALVIWSVQLPRPRALSSRSLKLLRHEFESQRKFCP